MVTSDCMRFFTYSYKILGMYHYGIVFFNRLEFVIIWNKFPVNKPSPLDDV